MWQTHIYALSAHTYTIENMNTVTWEESCSHTITKLEQIGINLASNFRTIKRWNIEYRSAGNFRHPMRDVDTVDPPSFSKYVRI